MRSMALFSTMGVVLMAVATAARGCPPHTVTGISSGGSMAVLHQMVLSASCLGSGVVAGSPYGCNILPDAKLICCTPPDSFNWTAHRDDMFEYLNRRSRDGLIDPVASLKARRVWLFNGAKDTVVYPVVMHEAVSQYRALGAAVREVFNIPAEHAWVTSSRAMAKDCDYLGPPYLNDCRFDMAGEIFAWLWGGSANRTARAEPSPLGSVRPLDVTRFIPWDRTHLLSPTWYVYHPHSDVKRIHVHYHGCGGVGRSPWNVPMSLAYGRLLDIAEAAGAVVLFPQVVYNEQLNPNECWDWWGVTGSDFDTHTGPQISTVGRVLQHLASTL